VPGPSSRPDQGRSEKELHHLQEEINIMAQLDHPHIIRLLEAILTPSELVSSHAAPVKRSDV
jgi:hypothetical protein